MKLALALILAAAPAAAITCLPQADLYATLSAEYNEAPQMQGLSGDGKLMQLWASEAGTWTLIVITPQGQACVVGVGGDFMDARQRPKPNL